MRKILKLMWFPGSSYPGFADVPKIVSMSVVKNNIFLTINWWVGYFCQKRSCASSFLKSPKYCSLRGTKANYLILSTAYKFKKNHFFSENQFDILPVSRLSHTSWKYSQSRWTSAGQTIYSSISNFRHTIIADQQLKQKTYIWIPNRNGQVK